MSSTHCTQSSPVALTPPAYLSSTQYALFLDVDGTLLEFAERPQDVKAEADLKACLKNLHDQFHGAVALVSGRPIQELDALFDWHGLPASGLHGVEIRHDGGQTSQWLAHPGFAKVWQKAQSMVASTSGIELENKRISLALHYRHAPEKCFAAKQLAEQLLELAGPQYHLQHGNHVIEIKPAKANKGQAIEQLLMHPPFHGRTPCVLGDDLTDEDAFDYANAHQGMSIIVGNRRPTEARHALADPKAVHIWLNGMCTSNKPST